MKVVAKTKALISFAVTEKLISVFVFAYAKSRFSHEEAHYVVGTEAHQFIVGLSVRYTVVVHVTSALSPIHVYKPWYI